MEDQCLTKRVKKAWKDSGKIYDDLIDMGEVVSVDRVARLAWIVGIQAQIGYKKKPGVYGGKPGADLEYAMIDGTIVKFHRSGQGAKGGLCARRLDALAVA